MWRGYCPTVSQKQGAEPGYEPASPVLRQYTPSLTETLHVFKYL